jgi:hypothetical protein
MFSKSILPIAVFVWVVVCAAADLTVVQTV